MYRLILRMRGRYTHFYFYVRDEVLGLSLLKSPFLLRQLICGRHWVRFSAMVSVLLALLLTLRTLARSPAALHLEILALRHQLDVLRRTRPQRVQLARTDRWLWVMLARVWAEWRTALVLVKPETVIAWHRQGFRLWWTWKSRRRVVRN